MAKEILEIDFKEEVINSSIPVLVDFYADWCGPCKMLSPVIESIGQKYGNSLKTLKINVDKNPNLASQYNVSSIPTLIIFKGDKAVKTMVGFKPQNQLEAEINSVIS